MRPAIASADLRLTHALGVLVSGFPSFSSHEFRRARDAICPPVPEDLAQAIISDCLLVLSQMGAAVIANAKSTDKIPIELQLVSILAAFQAGDDSRAMLMIGDLAPERRDGWTLSMRVLAKRLFLSGIELHGRQAEPAPPRRPAEPTRNVTGLRLVWSDGRRVG